MAGGSNRRRAGGVLVASPARIPLYLLGFAILYGTAGFIVIERFGPLDALYMTVTTLTTVGFGEIEPLSQLGRAFTISLIGVGFTAVFVLIAVFTSVLASGELGRSLTRRIMRRRIEELRDHYVVCGYGRVGRAAVGELAGADVEVVVIEVDAAHEPELIEAKVPYILADPTKEGVLDQARVGRARALLCAVDSDAVNVYITLSARALNPDLVIIARASSSDSVATLERAGADRVVSPYRISGARMASLARHPAVLEFADMVSVAPDLRIEELVVQAGSALVDQTVASACRPLGGVMVLAVRQPSGKVLLPPRADTRLSSDDVLIVLGPVSALSELGGMATA